MENPLKSMVLGTAAAAALAGCAPSEEQHNSALIEAVANEAGTVSQTIELNVEPTGDELQAQMDGEELARETNNGQYTKEEAAKIRSGTTRELE